MVFPKDKHIHIRISENERAAVQQRAARANLSVSSYIRTRVLIDDSRPIINTDIATLQKLYRQLKGIANNLNQCTRILNSHHYSNELNNALLKVLDDTSKATNAVADFLTDARNNI
jgi:hypothetical protein